MSGLGLLTWVSDPSLFVLNKASETPDSNSWLPVLPYPALSLRSLNLLLSPEKKPSLDNRHATARDGKYPYRLFLPNFVEPSTRKLPVTKYRSW